MKVKRYKEVELKKKAKGASIRWLLTNRDGMTDMSMRVIEIEPGGQTPLHSHPWEHQVFILKGSGRIVAEGETQAFGPGYAIFVGSNEGHIFHNGSDETMEFVCMIPVRAVSPYNSRIIRCESTDFDHRPDWFFRK